MNKLSFKGIPLFGMRHKQGCLFNISGGLFKLHLNLNNQSVNHPPLVLEIQSRLMGIIFFFMLIFSIFSIFFLNQIINKFRHTHTYTHS